MKLKGQVAIITGAASGIGLTISERFSQEGARVFMADIDMENCNKSAASINNKISNSAYPVKCDISSSEDVYHMVDYAFKKFGKIDILINNAAIAIRGNITNMDESDWKTVIDINLNGAFRCIKKVLPIMIQNGKGSIINISSCQAFRSFHNWTAYAAAKGGLLAMTNQLAGQFAQDNVRINAISPGTIVTPMNEKRMETEGQELRNRFLEMHAMGRLGEPKEVAEVALFLACDDSSFITGVDIKVDGGLSTLPRYREL